MAPLGGAVAPAGRRRQLEGAVWCQKVRKEILVTDPKAGAPAARRFRAIYDLLPGGGSDDTPLSLRRVKWVVQDQVRLCQIAGPRPSTFMSNSWSTTKYIYVK